MAKPVLMPKLGQTVEESTIVRWLKKEGETVRKGEILLEIETDKAVLEVENFVEGVLLKILRSEGDVVPVMEPIAFVGEPGEPLPEVSDSPGATVGPVVRQTSSPVSRRLPAPQRAAAREPEDGGIQPAPGTAGSGTRGAVEFRPGRIKISPRAARLARDSVIDPRPIRGTGPGGRIVEKDVRDYLENRGYDRIRITPAARQLAAAHGIDVLSVQAADGGKIRAADVENSIYELPVRMSRIQRVTARRLTGSFTTTPHFYVTVSVDMTGLIELRSRPDEEARFTLTDFIARAVILSLQEFPLVNASTPDGENIFRHRSVHLGLAVATEEGLLVPVIHGAELLSLQSLHERSEEVIQKARAGKLTPDEMSGGTFTISNMGMHDVENFSAIINPGESAILAVSSVVRSPVVVSDQVAVRSMMKMTVSVDHRMVDGVLAARFANAIKSKLEDIDLWKDSI